MMAGVMLVILGVTGMGAAVKFLPRPVVIGFTNGIAVLIASTQIRDFLGLRIDKVPGGVLRAARGARRGISTRSTRRRRSSVSRRSPPSSCCAATFRHPRRHRRARRRHGRGHGAGASRSKPSGAGSAGFRPAFRHRTFPSSTPALIPTLIQPALTVAMLGAIESLMSAVVADQMSGDRHNPNVELVAQGIANIVSPVFGGLPATGAIARTATNIRSGARTPVAGMVHAVTLLIVLLVAAPLASYIPMAVLGAILLVVSYNMGEWHEIPKLLRLTKTDISVWLVTFSADGLRRSDGRRRSGMILAALLFIRRVAATTTVSEVTPDYVGVRPRPHPPGQNHPVVRQRVPHPRTVALRRHGQSLARSSIASRAFRPWSSSGCAT